MLERCKREDAKQQGGLAEAVANGERDLTASFEYFRGSNRRLRTMARMLLIERISFLFLLYPADARVPLFLLHRNRARYLLLRNCKPLGKNRDWLSLCAGFSFHCTMLSLRDFRAVSVMEY